MDNYCSSYTEKTILRIDALEAEIRQLQLKLADEQTPTVLNDIRLRLGFLQWKKELLSAAWGNIR